MQTSAIEILDFLSRKIPAGKAGKLPELIRLIFNRKDPAFPAGHFKFDFSFPLSGPKYSRLRFTYNDFNEKKRLKAAAQKVFALFGAGPAAAGKKALGLSKLPLTFGIDWEAGLEKPDIKLYFEARAAGRKLIEGCCGLTDVDFTRVEPCLGKNKLCAAGVAFLADGRRQLKLYFYCGEKWTFASLTGQQLKAAAAFRKTLSAEKDAFYLHCVTFTGNSGECRHKHYKIYATKEYRAEKRSGGLFAKRNLELASLFGAGGVLRRYAALRRELGAAAGRGGALLYPIAVSAELCPRKRAGGRLGIYFSLIEAAHV